MTNSKVKKSKSKTNSKLSDPSALKKKVKEILDNKKFKRRKYSIGCFDDTIFYG